MAYIYFSDGIAVYRIIEPFNIFRKEESASKKIENTVIQNNIINMINIISCLFGIIVLEDPFILNNRIKEIVINPK